MTEDENMRYELLVRAIEMSGDANTAMILAENMRRFVKVRCRALMAWLSQARWMMIMRLVKAANAAAQGSAHAAAGLMRRSLRPSSI